MDKEIMSIKQNDTWELVSLPKYHKAINVKWVYKKKKNIKGKIETHKVKVVVKGYCQRVRINYDKIFALIA